MDYSTHTLFIQSIRACESNLILEIGCLDGKDTLIFRKEFPKASIISFEANPYNFKKLADAGHLDKENIELFNLAASDRNDLLNFFIYQSPKVKRDGIASLKRRKNLQPLEEVEVEAIMLQDFLENKGINPLKAAIWIDVEGAAYEVIQGLGPIIKQLGVIHVELELVSLYKDLHMFKEVNDYLKNNGFVCIGKQLHQGGGSGGLCVY